MLDVVGIDLADAGGDLRASQPSAHGEHLRANLMISRVTRLDLHEAIVEVIAATDDLNIVHEVRVDGRQADAAVVHLAGEHLIAEEVVTEQTRVRVGVVLRIGHRDIDEVTEKGVHRVVLLLDIVQVLGMLVDSVGAEDILEQEEREVVLVLDAGGIVEDADVAIVHLVVTDEKHAGVVDVLLAVGADTGAGLTN